MSQDSCFRSALPQGQSLERPRTAQALCVGPFVGFVGSNTAKIAQTIVQTGTVEGRVTSEQF